MSIPRDRAPMWPFWRRSPPLVSVVINFYNAERFLAEAIESVLAQTHRPLEIILVDDGSTDAGRAIAEMCADRHPFIHVVEHEGRANRGMSASRNLGLRHCRGRYVGFLDADDVWLPHKLESEVRLFREHPGVGMVCGATLIWYSWTSDPEELSRIGRRPETQEGQAWDRIRYVAKGKWEGRVRPPRLLRLHLRQRNSLPHTIGVLVRRSAALKVGGFEETFPRMYDEQVFFSKIALSEEILITKDCVAKYRQHGDSVCNRAILAGDWSGPPEGQRPAREAYFRWLDAYLQETHAHSDRIRRDLRHQLALLEPRSGAETEDAP